MDGCDCKHCGDFSTETYTTFNNLTHSRRLLTIIMERDCPCINFKSEKSGEWSVKVENSLTDEGWKILVNIDICHEYEDDDQHYLWSCEIKPYRDDVEHRDYDGAFNWPYRIETPRVVHKCTVPIDEDAVKLQEVQIRKFLTFA